MKSNNQYKKEQNFLKTVDSEHNLGNIKRNNAFKIDVIEYDSFSKNNVESLLINTHLVFNTLNLLNKTTISTYDIYIACKFINHNISTTTIKKWLNKHLNKKLTYTTIKTHLDLLDYYGYISQYKNNKKKYRLESEEYTTRMIIHGCYSRDNKEYWINRDNKLVLALKSINYIKVKKFGKENREAYLEDEKFTFFTDFNGIIKGYHDSRLKLTLDTIKYTKNKNYNSIRTTIDEELVCSFWYNRPVTKFEIKRVLHTTKDSIDQFKCNKEKYSIPFSAKQNSDDKFIYYNMKSKYDYVAETKGQLYLTMSCIYTKDEHSTRLYVNDFVAQHIFFDDTDYIINEEELNERKFAIPDKLNNKEKNVLFGTVNLKEKTSIRLESKEGREITRDDGSTFMYRNCDNKVDSINTARRRTNNYQSKDYLSTKKLHHIIPKIMEASYMCYINHNLKRRELDYVAQLERQLVFEEKKKLAIHYQEMNK